MSLKPIILNDIKVKNVSNENVVSDIGVPIADITTTSESIVAILDEIKTMVENGYLTYTPSQEYLDSIAAISADVDEIDTALDSILEHPPLNVGDVITIHSNEPTLKVNGMELLRAGAYLDPSDDYPGFDIECVVDPNDPVAIDPITGHFQTIAAKDGVIYCIHWSSTTNNYILTGLDAETGEYIFDDRILVSSDGSVVPSDLGFEYMYFNNGTLEVNTYDDRCSIDITNGEMSLLPLGILEEGSTLILEHPNGLLVMGEDDMKLYNNDFTATVNIPGTSSPIVPVDMGNTAATIGEYYLTRGGKLYTSSFIEVTDIPNVPDDVLPYAGGVGVGNKVVYKDLSTHKLSTIKLVISGGRISGDPVELYTRVK